MKKSRAWRAIACLIAVALAVPATAQDNAKFSELAGWWSADPDHGGESAHLALHFVEKDGKPEAELSVPALGVYDYSLGAVTFNGNSISTSALSLSLAWNSITQTIAGTLPADLVPVHQVPVEFKRAGPFEKPLPRDWHAPRPKILWSVETGAPVWAGLERDAATGMLYVGNEQGVLHAIDRDGKVRWKLDTGKPIRAQPKLIGGYVYLASDSGFLYKLDRKSGAEQWRARVDSGSAPRIPTNDEKTRWDRYGSSAVAHGKHLYIASRDKNLYALDIQTGREAWRVAAGDIMTATPALQGDSVIFAAFDGKVQAVSAKDGSPRWTYDAKLGIAGDVVVAGDRVLVGSRTYDLIALDAVTGKELWKHYYWFSWIESPPVVRDGVIYTGSSDATNIYAINLADGSLRWKTAVPGWSWQRTAVSDDLVIAGTAGAGTFPGSRAGSLVALDRTTGAIRWIQLDPPSEQIVKDKKAWGFGASPVIAEGVVYAADLNGKVYAFASTASLPATMKAVAIDAPGGPEAMTLHTLPVPTVDANDVLVEVHSAGVAVWDLQIRNSMQWVKPRYPYVLGSDGSGVVVAVGPSVTRFKIGDEVYGYCWDNPKGGFYAQYVSAPANCFAKLPRGVSLDAAGALGASGLTALSGVDRALNLTRGDTVIIHGASGAVGTLAVQLAKLRGARVLATASGEEGVALVRRLGADVVIDGRSGDIVAASRAFAPHGVDAVLAFAGGEALAKCLSTLREGGKVAWPNGVEPVPQPRPGLTLVPFDALFGDQVVQWAQLNQAVEAKKFEIPIAATFALTEAADAHRRVEAGGVRGKVVLKVR